jgi:hypothetical protein
VRQTWLTVRRDIRDGKACRVLGVADASGASKFSAVAFPWRREIDVVDAAGVLAWRIVRRRTFPITGVFDVVVPEGGRIGTLNRNGKVRDRQGALLGRFRDERSVTNRSSAAAAEGLMNLVAGLEGSSVPVGPSGYVWIVEGSICGALKRAKWPLASAAPALGDDSQSIGPARWLRGLTAALGRPAEVPSWCFVRANAWGADERLEVAAIVCAVELTYW